MFCWARRAHRWYLNFKQNPFTMQQNSCPLSVASLRLEKLVSYTKKAGAICPQCFLCTPSHKTCNITTAICCLSEALINRHTCYKPKCYNFSTSKVLWRQHFKTVLLSWLLHPLLPLLLSVTAIFQVCDSLRSLSSRRSINPSAPDQHQATVSVKSKLTAGVPWKPTPMHLADATYS